MKKIIKNKKEADFEIEVVNNQMEIRLANSFRKKIKDIRKIDPVNGPRSLLPESFQIIGTPGISDPIEVRGEMFTPHTSWRTYFPTDDLPDQLKSDLTGHTISYMFIPPAKGYIYWDRTTGDIKNISPQPIEDSEMENPFVVPLADIVPFLSGKKRRSDYYIGPSKINELEIKKRTLDFSLLTDVVRNSQLSMVTEEILNPDIEMFWSKEKRTLKIQLLTDIVPHYKHWLNFYITRRDDPYYLIQILKIQVAELVQNKKREVTREIDTDMDISIYTNLVFNNYNLVRKNA